MTSHTPHPTAQDWLGLIALTVLWGSAYAFIKLAVVTMPPATIAFLRIAGAAIVLTGWTVLRGRRLPPLNDKSWLWFAAMGLTGNALPFFLIN